MATYKEILKDLKAKKFAPIYLLMGDEPFFIDQIVGYIAQHVLSEQDKAFNQTVMYGEDIDVGTLDNAARRFPMMAPKQVLIVKEAQKIKSLNDLSHYASAPLESTVLVLAHKYKAVAKNTKLYKAISKSGVILESKKMYDNQIPGWIEGYLAEKKYTISPQASAMMAEHIGTELGKLANELDKLSLILKQEETIQPEHIEKNIGISKEYNNFELQKAIAQKDVLKANRIINFFAKNQKDHHIIPTIATLFSFFHKLLNFHYLPDKNNKQAVAGALKINPYFVAEYQSAARRYPVQKVFHIISYLREYDLKSKGFGNNSADSGDLLRELAFKIMH